MQSVLEILSYVFLCFVLWCFAVAGAVRLTPIVRPHFPHTSRSTIEEMTSWMLWLVGAEIVGLILWLVGVR